LREQVGLVGNLNGKNAVQVTANLNYCNKAKGNMLGQVQVQGRCFERKAMVHKKWDIPIAVQITTKFQAAKARNTITQP